MSPKCFVSNSFSYCGSDIFPVCSPLYASDPREIIAIIRTFWRFNLLPFSEYSFQRKMKPIFSNKINAMENTNLFSKYASNACKIHVQIPHVLGKKCAPMIDFFSVSFNAQLTGFD